jgi:cell division ATPase FtsA
VKVSEGTLERALRVMAQVLAVLQRQGLTVEVSEQGRTVVLIKGEHVSFGIEELIRKVVTQKARVPDPTDRWDYDEVVTHEPAGKLALIIHWQTWEPREQRTRWSDAKVKRVENLIPDFVAGLMRIAVALRRKEEERERREAEEQQREQEKAQLQEEIQEEETKLKQLNTWIDEWERAERMRGFIAVYAKKTSSWSAEKQPKRRAWIEWATQQADRTDPFVSEKPSSVLDRKHELRSW